VVPTRTFRSSLPSRARYWQTPSHSSSATTFGLPACT
jgi:hypothetical protein